MSILIDKVRIKNFRSLKNVEVNLTPVTILVGANNAGKTTFLRALNTIFGRNKSELTKDDLFIDKDGKTLTKANGELESITIDIRIVPIGEQGKRISVFGNQWLSTFKNIQNDDIGDFFAFRTVIQFGKEGDKYESTQYFLTNWTTPNPSPGDLLSNAEAFKAILLYFLDAQRDLQEDVKLRTSYFGKLASQIDSSYEPNVLTEINTLVTQLNDKAVSKSAVLSHLKNKLSKLNQTTQTEGEGVSINPFPKKIRDLHKGMQVDFQDTNSDAFGLEYHGMGTRSWASILSFSAFISWESQSKLNKGEAYFPLLALEEPESHLHPNAQRTLYNQLKSIEGQKIISTHSPYIAGQADLGELRHFYKNKDESKISQLYFSYEDEKRVKELLEEIEENGNSAEINTKNRPIIAGLLAEKRKKLNREEVRKIKREIMNTRGEVLFSKAIVLFEGETEEQALPILAKEYFDNHHPYEIGLNFVGVGGKGKYQPFLNLAKFLNLPWYLLSDGDGGTETEVKSQIKGIFGEEGYNNLFTLDEGADFEKYLIDKGYENELIEAVNKVKGGVFFPNKYIEEQHGQKRKGNELKNYKAENGDFLDKAIPQALLDCLREGKTEYAESLSRAILTKKNAQGVCLMPEKIKQLFDKINTDLNIKILPDAPEPV